MWVTKSKINEDIGDILGASLRTVNKHLGYAFKKLGVKNARGGGESSYRQSGRDRPGRDLTGTAQTQGRELIMI